MVIQFITVKDFVKLFATGYTTHKVWVFIPYKLKKPPGATGMHKCPGSSERSSTEHVYGEILIICPWYLNHYVRRHGIWGVLKKAKSRIS
jgi:hypothetical protein